MRTFNPAIQSICKDRDSLKSYLYKAIWQVSILASINEWPLLVLGLVSTLVFSKTTYWSEIRKWWFDTNNWLIAIFLTLLYTIIRHNVELNSFVFFAKRTIIISLAVLSLNYLLNYAKSAKKTKKVEKGEILNNKLVYIVSLTSASIFILAPFIANQGGDSEIFDKLVGIQGASKTTGLMFMAIAASLPLAMKADKKFLAIYYLFTLTSTMLITCSQSRMTAGVMMTSMIYIFGYIHKKKVINAIGKLITKLWIVYYAVFLPICTIAAPIIHNNAKWLAKILYTATGSRYTLAWSANLWHENGLNLFNNDQASSIFGFLSKPYFDTDFTALYGSASEIWTHGADVFVPGGAHSIFISILLRSQSITLLAVGEWILITLFMVLLIREYNDKVNSGNLSGNTLISLEIFMALVLSVLTAESISLSLYMLTLSTYLLLLNNNLSCKEAPQNKAIKPKTLINSSYRRNILSLSSPLILIMPLILYGSAYLLAKVNFFAYTFKLSHIY